MSHIVRLSVALVIALMMVIAFAGAALAFNPPDKAPIGVGANTICQTNFPAGAPGGTRFGDGVGPWNAAQFNPGPSDLGPIPFGSVEGNECTVPE